ncbi:MAG: hypothetical protein V3V55_07290 [Rhodospirillales bacterium]
MASRRAHPSHRCWRICICIGWVCGFALAYIFVARDLIAWVIVNTGAEASLPPDLAMGELMTGLLGMLGLGAFRTVEKLGGKAK